MRLVGFALTGLLFAMPAFAANLDGDWNGALDTPRGQHLRMLFHFRQDGGVLKTRFTSVDQAGASFDVDGKLDGNHLTVVLPFGATYDAVLAADGKTIAGTFTQRVAMPLTLTPGGVTGTALHPPEPGDLTIQTPTGTLAGTILRRGPIGAVIITGSGSANRDGNSTSNGGRGTYRAIAEGLAAHDITTLRFDKRGVGESAAAMSREDDLRFSIMADDVKAWAGELRKRIGARCVWLIGHSEGGLIALAAAQANPGICGLVLLASPGRPLAVLLHEQLDRQLPDDQKPAAFAAIDATAAGKPLGDVPPNLMALFRPSIQPYMRSEFALDPAAMAATLKIPTLILQGDADKNVSVADAKALARARPDATLKIEAGVNHSQRIAKDDPGSGPFPLAPGLVDTIAQFVKAHP